MSKRLLPRIEEMLKAFEKRLTMILMKKSSSVESDNTSNNNNNNNRGNAASTGQENEPTADDE